MSTQESPLDRQAEWAALRERYILPAADRPTSTASGLHHLALLSSDVERTINFYQGVLGFPLTEVFENRDFAGSTHFFFDIGNGNALAFFDFPGLDLDSYSEVRGGKHHVAISMTPESWATTVERIHSAGIETHIEGGSSCYFEGPDGERIELIAERLGQMGDLEIL